MTVFGGLPTQNCRGARLEQDSVESLNENRQPLEQEGTLSLSLSLSLSSLGGDPTPEIPQKATCCPIEWTKPLHRNWLENTLILQTRIFGDFELSRTFRCCAGLPCRCCHIRISYSTYGRDVPGQRFASLPRNQCEALRPFAI